MHPYSVQVCVEDKNASKRALTPDPIIWAASTPDIP